MRQNLRINFVILYPGYGGQTRLSYNCQAPDHEKEGVIIAAGIASRAYDERQIRTGTDCYVTSGKWEEQLQEKTSQEKEKAKVVASSFANPPLQKGVGVTN